MSGKTKRRIFLVLAMLILVQPQRIGALEICPEKMQAVLMVKIIPFIRELDEAMRNSRVRIGVVGRHEIVGYLAEASRNASFGIRVETVRDVDSLPRDLQILYIPVGAPSATLRAFSRKAKERGILTVCGDPNAVLARGLTLSFYIYEEKPKILIDMASAFQEGISFSSQVLMLADLRNVQQP